MSDLTPTPDFDDQAPMGAPTGRRAAESARRRFGVVDLLAMLVPVVTVIAVALVGGPVPSAQPLKPDVVPRERSTLVCPPGVGHVRVANADAQVSGEVELREPAATVDITAGRAASVEGLKGSTDHAVIVGSAAMAPGLLAARVDRDVATCIEPNPDYYFAGVGAGPEHSSTLQLVNPDGGTAIADVSVFGPDGLVEVPSLRGVAVRGGKAVELNLAAITPTLDVLGLQVTITRGRLGAFVRDVHDPLGAGPTRTAILPSQSTPADLVYLAGVTPGRASQSLTVLNPSVSESVVTIEVVTARAEFSPVGVKPLRVPAESTAVLDLSKLLRGSTAAQVVGLRLQSSQPIAATLHRSTDATWQISPAVSTVSERAALLLPRGARRRLVLQAVTRPGVAVIETRNRVGRVLGSQRLELTPGQAAETSLPARAALVSVRLERTTAAGAVLTPEGVLPLSELALLTQQAKVSPALF